MKLILLGLLMLTHLIGFADVKEYTFQQFLDHVQGSKKTFSQRYFVDDQYWDPNSGSVLLYICGEAECRPNEIQSEAAYAKRFNSLMVALEHRYYGNSIPFQKLTTANLKYLSVDLALKDLISFKKMIAGQYGAKSTKWYVAGCSYAGSLAAYAKSLYSNEFVGAIAGSAPVKARFNFRAYDRHTTKMLPVQCRKSVREIVRQATEAIKDDALRKKLKAKFTAKYIKDDKDFLFFLADVTAFAVQYGYHKPFCDMLKGEDDPMDGIVKFSNLFKAKGYDLSEFGFEAAAIVDVNKDSSARQWFYQTCTEMGYFQSAAFFPWNSTRSHQLNKKYNKEGCQRVFGDEIKTHIKEFNKSYYKRLLDSDSTKNIIFTNGSQDPWQKLSITPEVAKKNPLIKSIIIDDVAHCAPVGSLNSKLLSEQIQVVEEMEYWLK